MALAAHTPDDRVDQLITLTRRLTELVERETELFTARRPLEAAPFRDEKAKLANIYRQETTRIAKEPGLVAGAAPAARDALAETTRAFHAALDAHAMALQALQELTEGLVRSVADHVAQERSARSGYGPTATQKTPVGSAPLTLDQSA